MSEIDIGSQWNRWDLHFHTPSSYDYQNHAVTNEKIVEVLVANGIRVVAITDHHVMDVDRILRLQELGKGKLTVLPGIELRDDHGGAPIHYICIFSELSKVEHIWDILKGRLGLTETDVATKGGNDGVYVPIEEGAKVTRELGGVVSIHAGAKSNSIESIRNYEQFQQRIKYNITSKCVDLLEIGHIKDVESHLNIIFPGTGLDKPLILCSDNHDVTEYSTKCPMWIKADPTFRGLLMLLREPRARLHLGERPEQDVRVEGNPTKYIQQITLERSAAAPDNEMWFNGELRFNPGLVAIIGNKGSGKSALSDTIGLLGSCQNYDRFSFLNKKRFCHPRVGQAKHFTAKLCWISGEETSRSLDEVVTEEEVERLRYLPQEHVEDICNELAGLGEGRFEAELKGVIFSHVPESRRLQKPSLDDLVQYLTEEKQSRIDTLTAQLKEKGRARATLENRLHPAKQRELDEKVQRKQEELENHDRLKPQEVKNPAKTGDSAMAPELETQLRTAEQERATTEIRIRETDEALKVSENRLAVAEKLLAKLSNFQKLADEALVSIATEASQLGLEAGELLKVKIERGRVEAIRNEETAKIRGYRIQLDEEEDQSLRSALKATNKRLDELKTRLDAPNKAYQEYVSALKTWDEKRREIVGTEASIDTLEGLKAARTALQSLPAQITSLRGEQKALGEEIHRERLGQAEVFRDLYGPVQDFITNHELASERLHLEFRAELRETGFAKRFLEPIAQNKRGTFYGKDEGRDRVESMLAEVDWEDTEAVGEFLTKVDDALHYDLRDTERKETYLADQLSSGRKMEELFDVLYGLSWLEPHYVLKWEGKDLGMLSPGERGTLLLIFYLLVDKGDMPLIIDQPEGNLDNHTVAKVLVDCIRAASRRRQVFIVTHNPNLAVVCDADQVVHAEMDKTNGNKVTYTSGSLENPIMTQFVTDVLEGTRWAFNKRGEKYQVGN